MATYISLLRGVNVSGQNKLQMSALKTMFEKLHFTNVVTYIQSGNVVFTCEEQDPSILEQRIAAQIKNDFGLEVPVLVLTSEMLKRIINLNPFALDDHDQDTLLHVTLLADTPSRQLSPEMITSKQLPDEKVAVIGKTVYLYCPNGYGKTKLHTNFWENQLKVQATTRNWKTICQLNQLAN